MTPTYFNDNGIGLGGDRTFPFYTFLGIEGSVGTADLFDFNYFYVSLVTVYWFLGWNCTASFRFWNPHIYLKIN